MAKKRWKENSKIYLKRKYHLMWRSPQTGKILRAIIDFPSPCNCWAYKPTTKCCEMVWAKHFITQKFWHMAKAALLKGVSFPTLNQPLPTNLLVNIRYGMVSFLWQVGSCQDKQATCKMHQRVPPDQYPLKCWIGAKENLVPKWMHLT